MGLIKSGYMISSQAMPLNREDRYLTVDLGYVSITLS